MSDEVYEVDELLKARGHGKGRQFLVKWVGYNNAESTWEPRKNIHPDLVKGFEEIEAKKHRCVTSSSDDDDDNSDDYNSANHGIEKEQSDGDEFWDTWVPPEKKSSEHPDTEATVTSQRTCKRLLGGRAAERPTAAVKRRGVSKAKPEVALKAQPKNGGLPKMESKDTQRTAKRKAAVAAKTMPDDSEAAPTSHRNGEAKRKHTQRPVMSLEEAQRLATEENLQLVPSARQSKSGYIGVGFHGPHSCAVRAAWCVGGVETYLGSFSGVHEAALAVARHLGPEESAKHAATAAEKLAAAAEEANESPEGMNLEEAWRLAREEGIKLLTSTSNKCVMQKQTKR